MNKKKRTIFAVCRPPISSNIETFLQKLSSSINNALDKYENVVIIGDINIGGQNRRHLVLRISKSSVTFLVLKS